MKKQFEGNFFAPMPLGDSRVHVADRVKAVFGNAAPLQVGE
jgi:hypothetical protein